MDESEIMKIEDSFLAKVYQKFPVCITRGRGAVLYDVNGREYIDCMGGYGVSIVGHCHPKVVEAIKEQNERLLSCHGSFYNDKRAELLEKLVKIAPKGLNRIFLSNSGAESVECALKIAAKYTARKEVIAMVRGYHGKTLGALSVTWNPKYRKAFKDLLIPNFKFVPFGKIEKVKEAVSNQTAAIIVEPVQGESGVYIAPDGFLESLREICDEKGILLIFDEVQTGFGRTGKMWACENWDVTPDVMCVAKAMAGGIPIGATIAREDVMNALRVGEHTTTFGGNPVACAAACAVIDVILGEGLIDKARELGEFFKNALLGIQNRHRIVREVRGLGLMIAVESRFDVYSVLMKALERGVILLYSGRNIIRFLPPLVINKSQLMKVADTLEEILAEEERRF
ncbi:MAG: aspartate aminotransferase family protein [Candidatus Bathyarchaeia archaeon]